MWLKSYLYMATPADWNVWLGLSNLTTQGFCTWSELMGETVLLLINAFPATFLFIVNLQHGTGTKASCASFQSPLC